MNENNIKTVRSDLKSLMKEAQDLFHEAGQATGAKADELRAKASAMLDAASQKAHEMQTMAVEKSKAAAKSTDEFVHEHPWKSVGIAAGVGVIVGMLISRR